MFFFYFQPYDHLKHRFPTVVSLCTISLKSTLQTLVSNPTKCMKSFYDCAEILRFCYIRYDEKFPEISCIDDYMKESKISKQVEISDDYLYKLKVWMVLCNAKAGQMRYYVNCFAYKELKF